MEIDIETHEQSAARNHKRVSSEIYEAIVSYQRGESKTRFLSIK